MRRRHLLFALIVAVLLLSGWISQTESARTYLTRENSTLPFSDGVLVGKTLYLSGKLGLKPGTREVPSDPGEEARLVMESLVSTLKRAQMDTSNLVSVQVFCSDVAHYAAFNEVYKTYFDGQYPARAFVGSGPLLFGARFEVQGIAVRN